MIKELAAAGAALGLAAAVSTAAAAPEVRMAEILVKPESLQTFLDAVQTNMRTSIAKEPGVLGIYAVADKANPRMLTFFEIYASHEAYVQHTQTAHFKRYIAATKDLTDSKVLKEVDAFGMHPMPQARPVPLAADDKQYLVTVRITDRNKAAPKLAEHMAYLQARFAGGDFLMFGAFADGSGGWIMAKAKDEAALKTVLEADPLHPLACTESVIEEMKIAKASAAVVR